MTIIVIGLASTSERQLLATSRLCQPAQMSGAPSTSSLEVLKDLGVQGAFLRENVNHRHTNIHHKAQVRHMPFIGSHQPYSNGIKYNRIRSAQRFPISRVHQSPP